MRIVIDVGDKEDGWLRPEFLDPEGLASAVDSVAGMRAWDIHSRFGFDLRVFIDPQVDAQSFAESLWRAMYCIQSTVGTEEVMVKDSGGGQHLVRFVRLPPECIPE